MVDSRSLPVPNAMRSADQTLRAAAILQAEGTLGVTQLSRRLGISVGSAHRVLNALVYRNFAVATTDHRYAPGPLLRYDPVEQKMAVRLRTNGIPRLGELTAATGRSSHLLMLSGRDIRFIASVEGPAAVGLEGLEGVMFPARLSVAGRLLLAELPMGELRRRFKDFPEEMPDVGRLRRVLEEYRDQGYVVQESTVISGVTAIGVPVRENGRAVAGMAVSMPSQALTPEGLPGYVAQLQAAAAATETDLAADSR